MNTPPEVGIDPLTKGMRWSSTAAKRCSDVYANRDAVAVNATGVEVTLGGAAAFIKDATKYSIFKRR